MICGAKFSEDGKYRYELTRVWDDRKPMLVWIMLNPSTADAMKDDATIRRCIGFAKRWKYGGIAVLNLFAYRSTYPTKLLKVEDPVGPDNDRCIQKWCRPDLRDGLMGTSFIFAWGESAILGKSKRVSGVSHLIRSSLDSTRVFVLGHTKHGYPLHPLRVPYSIRLKELGYDR